MRQVLERIITACEKVMTEEEDARCHDTCPDKIKVDMVKIFLEMSLMDHSIDRKSAFIIQLKDILHPLLGRSTRDQENRIKEEPVDYIEEPVENKRPRKNRTITGTANQHQSVTQMATFPERRKQIISRTQNVSKGESLPVAPTSKEQSKTPLSFSKTDLSPFRSLNNSPDHKGSGSSVPPALQTEVTNESQSLATPRSRAADLCKLKELNKGDVIWVTKPSGEQITCIFLKIADLETWKVQVETEVRIGGKLRKKTSFLYLSVCQWGTLEK